MPDFNAQHTDRENAKPCPKASVRDNDLRRNGQGGLQDIARDSSNQNTESGHGGDAVTAVIK